MTIPCNRLPSQSEQVIIEVWSGVLFRATPVMFRRTILILLTLTAVGSAALAIATHQRPLYYWPNDATVPCWWKLYTAQSDRGHFRIAFISYGKWQPLSQKELEQREAEAQLWPFSIPPRPFAVDVERLAETLWLLCEVVERHDLQNCVRGRACH